MSKEHYEKLWKKVGNWEHEGDVSYKNRIPSDEVKEFISFLKTRNVSGNVLDLGCGGGRNTILLAKKGLKSYGIDFSKHAIHLANLHNDQEKAKANFTVGNVLNLPYEDDFFEAVVDQGCFHHLQGDKRDRYMKELLRVLKPNGFFMLYVFSTKTPALLGQNITPNKKWVLSGDHYTHFFTHEDVEELFLPHFSVLKTYEARSRTDKQRFFTVVYMKRTNFS